MAATIEAVVEAGQIRLPEGTYLPEKAQVFIVVPSLVEAPMAVSFETEKISVEEWNTRLAELDAAYEDYPDAEEADTIRLLRSKAAKVWQKEEW